MNGTKKKLLAGEPVHGGWIMIPHPSVAEIMAGEGFDWVAVDLEHSSASLRDVHEIALALKGTHCDLLVRLPACDPTLAKQVLDHGAAGIIVPSVNTPEQAAQAVAMAKFPPDGTRGASLCRATDFGRRFNEYYLHHNSEAIVVVMVEHYEAVANVDKILATPGVDAALIGPYDLSASLGLAGQLTHPKVLTAQAEILAACRRHSVAPGIHVVSVDPVELQSRRAQGFRFLACGIDTLLVQYGCRAMLKDLPTRSSVIKGSKVPERLPIQQVTNPDEPVLVTEKEFVKAKGLFLNSGFRIISVPANESDLAAAVLKENARVVVIGVERYEGLLYQALQQTSAGKGALLARFGVGHDGVDKMAARRNGILICNTPGALDLSVAELTLGLTVNLVRKISHLEAGMRKGEFRGETGRELHGMRLGIFGLGKIGRRVARMAHFGFGMTVWATGTLEKAELEAREQCSFSDFLKTHGLERYSTDAQNVLQECDVVSLHLPATPATHRFLNAERLKLFKPTALLINTARGSLVDEVALYDALESRRIGGAALDVFETEPYQPRVPGKDLRTCSNLVLTPHVGSDTNEANYRMAESCLANLAHFFRGELAQMNLVTVMPDVGRGNGQHLNGDTRLLQSQA